MKEAATQPSETAGTQARKRRWEEEEEESGLEKKINAKFAGNLLLASYLAHEYLTHRTLFGRKLEPETHFPANGDDNRNEVSEKRQIYATVATMLKGDDVHIPKIVNPSQLASWLRLC